jgi:hypothetical protein
MHTAFTHTCGLESKGYLLLSDRTKTGFACLLRR